MSRRTKYISLVVLVLLVLACNAVSQPFNQAKDLAGTAQSIATAMPIQTLQSLATQLATRVPAGTLEALPAMMPSLEALASQMPDISNYLNPQGTPDSEWNGIPVMPQATVGQEFKETKSYSFKVNATSKEVEDFYKEKLTSLGWSQFNPFNVTEGALVFKKDTNFLNITVIPSDDSIVVVLTML